MKKKILILIFFLLVSSDVFSQNPGSPGSFGLFHTYLGRSFQPGRFDIYANGNFYSKSDSWLWAGNAAITAGILDNLDLTVAARIYQNTNYPNGSNAPNDVFFTLKAGSFDFEKGRLVGALMAQGRIPVGDTHNYPFAEYASGQFEYGFKGAISYYSDPYLPDRSLSIHYNFGFWNHNDKDKEMPLPNDSTFLATRSAMKIDMALAAIFPISTFFDFRLEVYGYLFTSEPEGAVYSAEDYAAITPSMQYRPLNWLSLDLGADFRISSGERERTSGAPPIDSPMNSITSYPPWKIHFAAHFHLTPHKQKDLIVDGERAEVKKMVEFYEMIEQQKEKSKETQNEVKELRNERKRAAKEVKDIKTTLEGED